MTTYIVTPFDDDPDAGTARIVSGDKLDTLLAEFRTDPGTPDGAGLLIRKADYMASFTGAADYINDAPDQDTRRQRKTEVFHAVYGGGGMKLTRHGGTVTGRMVMNRPHPHLRLADKP